MTTIQVERKPGDSGMPKGAFRNHIGVNEGLKWSEYLLDRCCDIGFTIMRREFEWKEIEKERGVYDFEDADRYVEACVSRGLRIMFILGKTNPLYDTSPAVPVPGSALWEPYAGYVRACAERYAGRGFIWETWNEPNVPWMWGDMTPRQWIANTIAAADLIRSFDPDATVVGPAAGEGLSLGGGSWCDQVLRMLRDYSAKLRVPGYKELSPDSLWSRLNAWTGHQYTSHAPDCLIVDGVEYYELQRRVLDEYGGAGIPYCTGERGFTANPRPNQRYAFVGTEERAADYFTRQCLWGICKEPRGFTINYVNYSIYDCGKDVVGTPSGTALQAMLNTLGDYEYRRRIELNDPDTVMLQFERGDERRYAIWNRANRVVETNVFIQTNQATVVANDGTSATIEGKMGGIQLRIGPSPKYIKPIHNR